MREMSVAEQRYEAVRAVIADGETVTGVAARFGVSRKTVHGWLVKYEIGGLEGLVDGSHRPRSCPHQMPARRARDDPRRHTDLFEVRNAASEGLPDGAHDSGRARRDLAHLLPLRRA
jgi:transposase